MLLIAALEKKKRRYVFSWLGIQKGSVDMDPYDCSNSIRDSEDIEDWTEGPCGENPGLLRLIVDAAYEWRVAEMTAQDSLADQPPKREIIHAAFRDMKRKEKALRILLDQYQSELRTR